MQRSVFLPLLAQADRAIAATAVERFSERHDRGLSTHGRYSELLPTERPRPGEQYAFEVDLDRCTGCKACVSACRSLNGLDEDETWRSVGTLHGGSETEPIQLSVTTACHHCVDPACQTGCPVGAYEKDAETGAVRHLDDQCIGCRYCTFTCPYEVPRFNRRLGIVRKCDLCVGRLKQDEAPACVQGCPNEAIAVRVVATSQVVEDAQGEAFLPGTPSPAITLPTTAFRSARALPRNLLPADFYALRPSENHPPLVAMLVLTQLAVGAFVVEGIERAIVGRASGGGVHASVALGIALLALGASVLHLGRPWLAFRAVLGLRTSWLSREIVAFGAFAMLASACAVRAWAGELPIDGEPDALLGATALSGLCGVGCSVMVYAATRRAFWAAPATAVRFFGTSLLLGLALRLTEHGFGAPAGSGVPRALIACLLACVVVKLAVEAGVLVRLRDHLHGDLKRSARLLTGPLARTSLVRTAAAALGCAAACAGLTAVSPTPAAALAAAAFALLLVGELCERSLFFRAMSAARMPGALP